MQDKCLICEEEITDEQGFEEVDDSREAYLIAGNGNTGLVHDECTEQFGEYGTRITAFTPQGDVHVTLLGGIIANDEGIEIPANIFAAFCELAQREVWVSTDAWRGYTDFSKDAPKYKLQRLESVSILHWDESEAQEAAKFEALKALMKKLQVPFFAAFGRTSNLFASTADYFIFKCDVRKVAGESKQ